MFCVGVRGAVVAMVDRTAVGHIVRFAIKIVLVCARTTAGRAGHVGCHVQWVVAPNSEGLGDLAHTTGYQVVPQEPLARIRDVFDVFDKVSIFFPVGPRDLIGIDQQAGVRLEMEPEVIGPILNVYLACIHRFYLRNLIVGQFSQLRLHRSEARLVPGNRASEG